MKQRKKLKERQKNLTFHISHLTSNHEGITLIALVITIIVMLILVAVTIRIAVNGKLFEYAGKSVKETENAMKTENEIVDGRIKVGNKWYDTIEDYINKKPSANQGNSQTEGECILEVELQVDEGKTTGTEIPIKVSSVTKEGQNITEGLSYYYYLEGNEMGESTDALDHTFDSLDNKKTYTLKCHVEDSEKNYGEGEITVIAFSIDGTYYRATKGMNWKQWANSNYDKRAPETVEEKYKTLPFVCDVRDQYYARMVSG